MSLSVLRGVRIGIIGTGTMGQALISGLLARGLSPRALRAADASGTARRAIRRRFRLQVVDDSAWVARHSDLVILAVKPQQVPEVIGALAAVVTPRQVVVSIAAGITLRWLQSRLARVPVVRVMPNLPATVGCGFAAVAGGQFASARHRAIAKAIFGAVGEVVELPERHFDAVTAVSGSGPAYLFFLVQAWEAAAQALGLPLSVAARAIRQTVTGSAALLEASGEPASRLIARVASKRGTTEAALNVLARRRVHAHLVEALQAAARRSRELSSRYQIPTTGSR